MSTNATTARRRRRKNPAAVTLGRLGGRVKSEAKAAAVRENGKRGGRPRKPDHELKAPRRRRV